MAEIHEDLAKFHRIPVYLRPKSLDGTIGAGLSIWQGLMMALLEADHAAEPWGRATEPMAARGEDHLAQPLGRSHHLARGEMTRRDDECNLGGVSRHI